MTQTQRLKNFIKKIIVSSDGIVRFAKKITSWANPRGGLDFVRIFPDVLFDLNRPASKRLLNSPYLRGKKYFIITDNKLPRSAMFKNVPIIRSLDEIPEEQIAKSVFYIYFTCDSDALPILKKIKEKKGLYIPHEDSSKTSYRFVNRTAFDALKKTWNKTDQISHLCMIVHENICEALELTKEIDGDFVEIGVYLGGSALTAMNYMAEVSKKTGRPPRKTWLIDTYDGFNYEEAKNSSDIFLADTHKLFGVEKTKEHIKNVVSGTQVPFEMVVGNICADELPPAITKIAVANIDVDLYEATADALTKCAPRMAVGGIMICEDPASTPSLYGAYMAMSEFLETPLGKCFMPIFKTGQYFLIRKN